MDPNRNKNADIMHMLAEAFGVSEMYDDDYRTILTVRNSYDSLFVTVEYEETDGREAYTEEYRLTVSGKTVERVR